MTQTNSSQEAMRHYYRGRVYESVDELDTAIEEYKKSIELGAGYADVHNSLGRVYVKKGLFEEAEKEFEIAIEINPHYLEAKRNLDELLSRVALIKKEKITKHKKETPVSFKKTYVQEKKFNKNYIFIVSGILLLIIAGIFIYKKISLPEQELYFAPSINISGITYDNQYFWLCDWVKGEIYKCKIKNKFLNVNSTYTFKEISPISLNFINGYIWTSDAWSGKLYKHIIDNKLTVIQEFNLPLNITSFCYDGENIWVCDNSTKKIHKLNMDTLSIEKSFEAPSGDLISFIYDGKYFWLVDSKNKILYKYNRNIELLKIYPLNIENKKISAVYMDRKYIYFTFDNEQQFVRYSVEKFLKKQK